MSHSHIYMVIAFFSVLLIFEIRFLFLLKSVGLEQELCKCNASKSTLNATLAQRSSSTHLKWVASLALERRDPIPGKPGPFSMFCTASGRFHIFKTALWDFLQLLNPPFFLVLSSSFLLSAARCFLSYRDDGVLIDKRIVYPHSMFALAGIHDFTRSVSIQANFSQILGDDLFIHPDYAPWHTLPNSTRFVQNDLVLIKLKDPFELGYGIFPGCLFEFDQQAFSNASLFASAFGAQDPPSSYYYRLRTTIDLKQSSACSQRNATFNESISLCVDSGNSSFFFYSGDSGQFVPLILLFRKKPVLKAVFLFKAGPFITNLRTDCSSSEGWVAVLTIRIVRIQFHILRLLSLSWSG